MQTIWERGKNILVIDLHSNSNSNKTQGRWKTILVVDPWYDPTPFKSAWSIWEIYCTSVTGSRLLLTMHPDMMADFKKALVGSFEEVHSKLCKVDVSESKASVEVEHDMIHNEIRRTT